jgi:large subunit ribosomal protein L18
VSHIQRLAHRRETRAFRVRKRVRGTPERPRVTVHRTHLHIYAQVVDDTAGRTLCECSSLSLKIPYGGNLEAARKVGAELGRKAKELEIAQVGFDRGRFRYQGRVRALAEALREAGVRF